MITTGAYDRAIRTQKTFYAKIRLAAGALHAKTATFTYLFVTFVAMLSASLANQSTAVTMPATGANDRATRTQITGITEIFFTTGTLVAFAALRADVIVTLGTMLSATRTQIGAI